MNGELTAWGRRAEQNATHFEAQLPSAARLFRSGGADGRSSGTRNLLSVAVLEL